MGSPNTINLIYLIRRINISNLLELSDNHLNLRRLIWIETLKRSRFLLLFSVLHFISCEFEPSGDNFNEIEKPDLSDIVVDLSSNEGDTIFLIRRKTFDPILVFGDRQIKQFKVVLKDIRNGTILYEQNRNQGITVFTDNKIEIDPDEIEPNTYVLRIEVVADSGSGSLSDLLEVEIAQVWREWIVQIDQVQNQDIIIKSVGVKNGTVVIEWEEFETIVKEHFDHIQIERLCPGVEDGYFGCSTSILITDPDITSWEDHSYLSGNRKYRLRMWLDGKHVNKFFESEAFDFTDDIAPQIQLKEDNIVEISWDLVGLQNNFGRAVIAVGSNIVFNSTDPLIGIFSDPEPLKFGEERTYTLTIAPRDSVITPEGIVSEFNTFVGDRFHEYKNIKYSAANNSIYAVSDGQLDPTQCSAQNILWKFNEQSLAIEDCSPIKVHFTRPVYFNISENGDYAYFNGDPGFVQFDPLSLAQRGSFDTDVFNILKVGNNNRLMSGRRLVNPVADTVIRKFIIGEQRFDLSLEGDYVYYNDSLFSLSDAGLVGLSKFDFQDLNSVSFSQLINKQLIMLYNDRLEVIEVDSFSKLLEFAIEEPLFIGNHDPVSNYFAGFSSTKGYVYDLTSGELIDSFLIAPYEASNNKVVRKFAYYLANKRVFSSNGFYIKINE